MGFCKDNGSLSIDKKIENRIWRSITLRYLEKLYELMPKRMLAVIEAQGGHTKY